jgi:hypothetical protein
MNFRSEVYKNADRPGNEQDDLMVTIDTCIREVLGSILGLDIGYPDRFL